jgi:hypothetical protein
VYLINIFRYGALAERGEIGQSDQVMTKNLRFVQQRWASVCIVNDYDFLRSTDRFLITRQFPARASSRKQILLRCKGRVSDRECLSTLSFVFARLRSMSSLAAGTG